MADVEADGAFITGLDVELVAGSGRASARASSDILLLVALVLVACAENNCDSASR